MSYLVIFAILALTSVLMALLFGSLVAPEDAQGAPAQPVKEKAC